MLSLLRLRTSITEGTKPNLLALEIISWAEGDAKNNAAPGRRVFKIKVTRFYERYERERKMCGEVIWLHVRGGGDREWQRYVSPG
jgi:hypothetical protein